MPHALSSYLRTQWMGNSVMRDIFRNQTSEMLFRENGYVVIDLLDEDAIADLHSFYAVSFQNKREVVAYARDLPYYISIFDRDTAHKRIADERISRYVERNLDRLLDNYEVFYSNFMIKFPGDGEIEAHQDFNFVDESQHVAFNLWCPLVDSGYQNGGLCVIAGSHNIFRTQRGPNLPRALTQYNEVLKRYGRCIPLRKGQAVIFDHKLIHYSPPNRSGEVRVAIQSVLKPREVAAVHYVFDQQKGNVQAYIIDKDFVLETNLWDSNLAERTPDHQQPLIPLPAPGEVEDRLVELAVRQAKRRSPGSRRVMRDADAQRQLEQNGFVTLPLLGPGEIQNLRELFLQTTGGVVENTAYGMYIGLEDADLARKRITVKEILRTVVPRANEHFVDCKPHLGSFLVKAPALDSYTYPHQDWTFVNTPDYRSMTVWIALVAVDEANGALGFVPGSHEFFDKPVGSPSPDFRTCAQGHEAVLYEYLEFVPLKPGEAVVFDNRTIHGATPNRTDQLRVAAAIGMTPREAQLYHYFLAPGSICGASRTLAKLRVDSAFFERHSVASLKQLYDANRMPEGYEIEDIVHDDFLPYSAAEIRKFCERSGLRTNGHKLAPGRAMQGKVTSGVTVMRSETVKRMWQSLFRH